MKMRKGDIIFIQDLSEYIEEDHSQADFLKMISNRNGEVLRSRSDGKFGSVYFPSLGDTFEVSSKYIRSREPVPQKLRRMGIFSF